MVHAVNPSHLLIAGDFNIPQIKWTTGLCSAPDSHHSHKFLSAVHDCLLFQHITHPLMFRDGEHPSLLGLMLTNEKTNEAVAVAVPGCANQSCHMHLA